MQFSTELKINKTCFVKGYYCEVFGRSIVDKTLQLNYLFLMTELFARPCYHTHFCHVIFTYVITYFIKRNKISSSKSNVINHTAGRSEDNVLVTFCDSAD